MNFTGLTDELHRPDTPRGLRPATATAVPRPSLPTPTMAPAATTSVPRLQADGSGWALGDRPAAVQQPVVVGFDVQPAQPDREQSGPGRVGVEVGGDVGGVHDLGQPGQRRVAAQVVVADKDLEGALAAAVGVAGAGGVEADGV